MANYLEELFRAASNASGKPITRFHDSRVYLQPGGKSGPITNPGPIMAERIRTLDEPATLAWLAQAKKNPDLVRTPNYILRSRGIHPDDNMAGFHAAFQQTMEDPQSYAMQFTPYQYLHAKVYGDQTGDVINRALASARRPSKSLEGNAVMYAVAPQSMQRNMHEPTVLIRTPGMALASGGGGGKITVGPANGRTIFMPRFYGPSHVLGHEVRHAIQVGDYAPSGGPMPRLFDVPGLPSPYKNTFPEAAADAGVLRGYDFMMTGQPMSNQAQAKAFIQRLLDEPPDLTAADPRAKFGPNKDNPVHGYQYLRSIWGDTLRKVNDFDNAAPKGTPRQLDRFRDLLPKVLMNKKSSAAVA